MFPLERCLEWADCLVFSIVCVCVCVCVCLPQVSQSYHYYHYLLPLLSLLPLLPWLPLLIPTTTYYPYYHYYHYPCSINVCMTIHLTLLSNNSISHFSQSCTRIDSNCNGHRRGRVCYICMCVMEGSSTMLHLLGWSSKQPNQIVLQVPGDTHRFWPPGSGTCPGSLQAQGSVLLHRGCWGEQDPFFSQ